MHWDFPPPAECLFERDARIVEPSLVEEFGGGIWPTGPRQRRHLVDHHPQLVFRFLLYSVSVFFGVGVHTLASFRQSDYEALVLLTLNTIQNGETGGKLRAIIPSRLRRKDKRFPSVCSFTAVFTWMRPDNHSAGTSQEYLAAE